MPNYETLIVSNDDGVVWVSLNRPDVRNAINEQMQAELRSLWRAMRWDDTVRCIVLTAEGDHFCTGIDRGEAMTEERLAEIAAGNNPGFSTPWVYDDPGRDIGPKACDLWKPVIAAVKGQACAGAFYMLGETEFIIASEDATFFDPHVTYRDDRRVRAPLDAEQDAVPRGDADVTSRRARADERSARTRDRAGVRGGARRRAEERAGWAARVIADSPVLAIQGTLRVSGPAATSRARRPPSWRRSSSASARKPRRSRRSQDRFSSGVRPEWRMR